MKRRASLRALVLGTFALLSEFFVLWLFLGFRPTYRFRRWSSGPVRPTHRENKLELVSPEHSRGTRSRAQIVICSSKILTVVLACGGCAAELPPPPRAPQLSMPGDALPADLDCVVRVDLLRVRSALGPAALAGLRRGAAATASELAEGWIADAIERSDVALVAFRPELGDGGPDNVIVLRGRFEGVKPPVGPNAWGPAVDLGGDVRRFDRVGTPPRSSPVRLYAFGDEQLVFVSAAEIDAVEAVLEGGRAPSTVQPPARGVLAFAARLRGAKRTFGRRFPILASALGDARSLNGSLEVRGGGLVAEVALELETDEQASGVAALVRSVATVLAAGESRWAGPARATTLESAGHFAVLRATLSREELAGFLPQGE